MNENKRTRHNKKGDYMNSFNKELLSFLNKGTCSFTSILEIEKILKEDGFIALEENKKWQLSNNKYYVIRNNASIIAFILPKNNIEQFKIVCTHCDTPSLMIKPNPGFYENGYCKLNVAPYGGLLNYGFMDRPMGIAGRIILKKEHKLTVNIVDTQTPVAIIPSIAIHQNDKANSNLDLNPEVDLIPIYSSNKDETVAKFFQNIFKTKEDIIDYELYLYNSESAKILNNEFIASPRIDNLTCTYAAIKAFKDALNTNSINCLAVFNSEEIGSNTIDGADSNFLIDTLKKISKEKELNLEISLANSIILSADNTHARHPNHDNLSDHTNTPPLNSGVLIMREMNGTSTSISSSLFKEICLKNNIPCSYYTSRNDFATGSTQSGASLRHLSIHSLDIGLPMLAMHSGLELIGLKDTYLLFKSLKKTYEANFTFKNNNISF